MSSSTPDPVLVTALTYEREAAGWHVHTAHDRGGWQPTYDRFAALLPNGGLVLDLGCGSGEDAPALTAMGMHLFGLDISSALLSMARRRGSLTGRLMRGEMRALPLAAASLDGVWADGCVHHVAKADAARVLAEVARVLRTAGVFVISVERGTDESFVEASDGMQGRRWYARYEPDELQAMLDEAGFEVVDHLIGEASEHSINGFVVVFGRKR